MVTTLSPSFVLTNYLRDVQTALVNLSEQEGKELSRKVMRDLMMSREPIRAAYRLAKDKLGDSAWDQSAREFRDAGGQGRVLVPRVLPRAGVRHQEGRRGQEEFLRPEQEPRVHPGPELGLRERHPPSRVPPPEGGRVQRQGRGCCGEEPHGQLQSPWRMGQHPK